MNSPPKIAPGIEPRPPITRPTSSVTARMKVKLSGATNWMTIALSAPATPVKPALTPRRQQRLRGRANWPLSNSFSIAPAL